MKQENKTIIKNEFFIAAVVAGSLWGLWEVLGNEFIRNNFLSLRAGLLTGGGFLIMGLALGLLKRPALPLAIAFVAALSKQIIVPVTGCSPLCSANSCLALMLMGGILSGASILMKPQVQEPGRLKAVAVGFTVPFLAASVFYFGGMRLAPCPYLLTYNTAGGFLNFMMNEGLAWSLISALTFPAGLYAGYRAAAAYRNFVTLRTRLYYGVSLAVTVLSITMIVVFYGLS